MRHHSQKEELFAHLAAEFAGRESNRTSLITVTRAELSEDEKRATIFISVLPEEREHDALAFLSRKGGELRDFIARKAKLRVLPFFTFSLDFGEKNRQQLEELS